MIGVGTCRILWRALIYAELIFTGVSMQTAHVTDPAALDTGMTSNRGWWWFLALGAVALAFTARFTRLIRNRRNVWRTPMAKRRRIRRNKSAPPALPSVPS